MGRGEFQLIERFVAAAPREGPGVRLGIGDDCALLAPPAGEVLALTVDAVVEDVHFDRRAAPEDVGWKALAVNLSDLAAMGARPLWAVCALGVPPRWSDRAVARVGRGLGACARRYGVTLVGGNVSRARELSVTVALLGAVEERRALLRSGARAGDAVLVSGTLGDAALGLARGAAPALVRRQRRPSPRLALGRALRGLATSCIDVSDGLVQDLGHVCEASGVGASVRLDVLPLSAAYRRAGVGYDLALAGGEDYELLFTVPVPRLREALRAGERAGVPVAVVGSVIEGSGVQVIPCRCGIYRPPAGWDHRVHPRKAPALTWRLAGVGSIPP